ncbi:MAG: zinc ABC transporter substrate-binding protein, partial [Pseudomonadota bacterium]
EALDTEIRAKIASDAKPFAILHDAILYFEVAYDVDSVGALTGADATEGGPRRRSTLSEALEVSGEICLLHEVGEADAAADLARETGTTAVEIDPLGAKLDLGPGLYEATMLGLAETIAACTNP